MKNNNNFNPLDLHVSRFTPMRADFAQSPLKKHRVKHRHKISLQTLVTDPDHKNNNNNNNFGTKYIQPKTIKSNRISASKPAEEKQLNS